MPHAQTYLDPCIDSDVCSRTSPIAELWSTASSSVLLLISHELLLLWQGGLGDGGSLKVLSLRYTKKLETLPSSISDLISLETLDLGGSAISVLPKSLGELCALRELNLEECYNLQELTPGGCILHGIGYGRITTTNVSPRTCTSFFVNLKTLAVYVLQHTACWH